MEIKYSLDLGSLKKIPLDKYEKNFTIIVNDKPYHINRILADLISPTICNYHYQDETIDTFIIKTEQLFNKIDYFENFLNLYKFDEVSIDQNELKYYSEYFLLLGNIDEYFKLQSQIPFEITPQNVIDRLLFLTSNLQQKNLLNGHIIKLIEYSSEHFYEIDKSKICELDIDLVSEIIGHQKLKIEDEDSLFQFILKLYENDKKYSYLFEYVYFENIKDETISEFVDKFDIDFMTSGTWLSICYRLFQSKKRDINEERYINKSEIITILKDKNDSTEFNGIMRYLTKQAGGNIHDKGVINITSNSYQNKGFHPKNLVDYNSSNFYASNDEANGYICFDFKDKQIQLSSYSIQSIHSSYNNNHFRNWIVDVSNDKENWEIIDEHSNDSTLNGYDYKATFDTKQTELFYRYVRIRQTGFSWHNNYWIYFPYLEFYGKIKIQNK